MMAKRCAGARQGFTLVEMLVALTLTAIIGAAITALFVSQERSFDTQTKLQSARDVTRGARNLITSELRMLDRDSGVIAASAEALQLRVPFAMGVVCGQATGVVVNLLPVDSAMLAYAAYGGYAVRDFGTGRYQYVTKNAEPASASAALCITNQVDTVAGGRTVQVSPAIAAARGAPVLLWQIVRYHFAPSLALPGRRALYREVPALNLDEEILAPFADSAHFEFYVDGSNTPVTSTPADLKRLTGIELVLDALSERPQPNGTFPLVRLRTAVFFKNRRS
ncbi:MAG: type II secretion system protein [Gemmatimonadetes bacterium]|nr:type II secretion system protein [Gemmatimonadota bacterium]